MNYNTDYEVNAVCIALLFRESWQCIFSTEANFSQIFLANIFLKLLVHSP